MDGCGHAHIVAPWWGMMVVTRHCYVYISLDLEACVTGTAMSQWEQVSLRSPSRVKNTSPRLPAKNPSPTWASSCPILEDGLELEQRTLRAWVSVALYFGLNPPMAGSTPRCPNLPHLSECQVPGSLDKFISPTFISFVTFTVSKRAYGLFFPFSPLPLEWNKGSH